MSRLIDADKFMDFIKDELKQNRPDNIHIRNIIRVLEDLPSALEIAIRERKLKVKDLICKLRRNHEIEIREDNYFLCYTIVDSKLLKEFEECEVEDWYVTRNHGNDIVVINIKGECA